MIARRHVGLAAALGAIVALPGGAVRAAVTGSFAGVVTDERTGRGIGGVTVIASGPALQGEQLDFTESNGRYHITELPPGEYLVRFYFADVVVERAGIVLQADKTLSVDAAIPTDRATAQRYVVRERAPTVDVGHAQLQTQVTDELVRNTPVRGRTFDAVLLFAPGSTTDGAGFAFNGATGNENNFLVDGLNTTNNAFGLLGARLSLEFIATTEIITGGYDAEYGRATGGVVNVVTKSGSNELHGGAWLYGSPPSLDPLIVARTGESIATRTKVGWALDLGADLGGPIVKDRLWFYAGFHPQLEHEDHLRGLRRRTADAPAARTLGAGESYAGDLDPTLSCPAYLGARALCPSAATGAGPRTGTGPFRTASIPGSQHDFASDTRRYEYILKLTAAPAENHRLSLTYVGAPSTFTGAVANPDEPNNYLYTSLAGSPTAFQFGEAVQAHNLAVHLVSKLLDRHLVLDALAGWSFEERAVTPAAGGDAPSNIDLRTHSLADFEDVPACRRTTLAGGASFNPCPVVGYIDGGYGALTALMQGQRFVGSLGVTYFFSFLGLHALKVGGDFEANVYRDHRRYTGHGVAGTVTTFSDTDIQNSQHATREGGSVVVLPEGFDVTTTALDGSLYLRDSWNVGFLPGLTVNAGLRWEAQAIRDPHGQTVIGIYDNLAPRLGAVWDFTRKGHSKVYASYGRFYESVPLDIADRALSGEGFLVQNVNPTRQGCPPDPQTGRIDVRTCRWPPPRPTSLVGGSVANVAPNLQGQYSNEVVLGAEYDVGLDLVLGAAYVHRDLGRIIEDYSSDGGLNYFIGNPGQPIDASAADRLRQRIDDLAAQATREADIGRKANLVQQRDAAATQLAGYLGSPRFEKPRRDYNALVLTANKRLTHRFLVLASYTYSRTLGNYPGLYQASTGQNDPNFSTQYDLRELLANRDGPLPGDRPHNLKISGAYHQPIGSEWNLHLGLAFTALSGTPIEVLGRHPTYGTNEVFLLPRGSGGRTPMLTSLDLHVALARRLRHGVLFEASCDVFNLLDQQGVTAVDPTYTDDRVAPIVGGTVADLRSLKTLDGAQPRLNANYGQPTSYQAPLSLRLGARVSF